MMHPLQEMMSRRNSGEVCGITSYCTANELALEAIMEHTRDTGKPVLIEATANQINQFGGYTGMTPDAFIAFIKKIADKIGLEKGQLILGGDHLGPLTWSNEPEALAMEKSRELVKLFVLAGFTKIHLDTSMKLGDDDTNVHLSTQVIARRGVELYRASMEAYEELKKRKPDALRPVFVIGSEVPIPGGAQEAEEGISVTKPKDFEDTVCTYQRIFKENGLEDAWDDIIAVVVQPGVEFGDAQVFFYDHLKAKSLCECLTKYPGMAFEGHSTDYQTKEALKQMVEDGIAILKVGPALTFGLCEGLSALAMIEDELIVEERRSYFTKVLERTMLENPSHWQKHYSGTEREKAFARKYSFSDRCRYYLGEKSVVEAMEKLFNNLSDVEIPINILHRYMPLQYEQVVRGQLTLEPRKLVKASVLNFVMDYEYATQVGPLGYGHLLFQSIK
jgi:D-tagatose-1,6-bisphosphate aldolase subunit GatZ/KbaZ